MAQTSLYQQVLDYANRANPYPLYARLRETPIVQDPNGTYVVSTYRNIEALLHDPRVSSDASNRPKGSSRAGAVRRAGQSPAFLNLDPPQHDTMRRQAMWQFGPPHTPDRIDSLRPMLEQLANSLVDAFQGKTQVDIVEEFSYPLPVTAICRLLGVPREDEPRFHKWADALVMALDPTPIKNPLIRFKDRVEEIGALKGLSQYMAGLVAAHRKQPGDDILSGFVTDPSPDGPMSDADMVAIGRLLLIAGHETTVNLITNGTLTLLRHPGVLERLRREPELSIRLVEELLRYEPPVQIVPNRTAMADIELPDGTILQGSAIALMLAAGNRDPARFPDPERFDPNREDIEHLGLGSGIHSCFGAPLARLEGQIALTTLARRLRNPRLVVDPPPYRPNPVLRGPRHLQVQFDGIAP